MLISDVKKVTPNLLTAILRAGGYLWERASVAEVKVEKSSESNVAMHHHLRLRYLDYRNLKTAPEKIFLKITKPDNPVTDRETVFYGSLAPEMQQKLRPEDLPLPVCYDAYYDEDSKRSHLLLEDLSGTHQISRDGLPPSKVHREKMMDRLAYLHGYWWQRPRLGKVGTLHTEESLQAAEAIYQSKFEAFVEAMKFKVPAKQFDVLEKIVSQFPPRRRERMLSGKGMTLVHRDPHPMNFLYAFNNVKLIDWQSWRVDAGTDDAAYLIACHYPDNIRKFEERNLLQRYFNTLTRNGAEDYAWDDLLYDYRASIARCIAFLLVAWTPEKGLDGWKRASLALNAFEEWDGLAIYGA